jgi:DNA-binding transcriptional LysR family regulator
MEASAVPRHGVRWRGVELRHLEALAAVGEEGSFHRAASRLGYSQSAISQQVAALERVVGQRLLHRSGGSRSVEPTDAGRLLIEHAKAITARLAGAEEQLATLASPRRAVLRVGADPTASARVVPEALARLGAEWDDARVELAQTGSEVELLRRLERGELDLAFVHLPILRGPFGFERLPADEYVLVVAQDAELDDASDLARVATLPLLGFNSSRAGEGALAYLRALGHEPRITAAADDALTLQRLVAAGLGAALLPRLVLEDVSGVRVLPLPGDVPRRASAIAWHRELGLRPAASAFVRAAVAACDSQTERRVPARLIAPEKPAA